MRLWSFHPKYLDTKGLVALWRESLLARKVLEGQTKGYRHHPQLQRFQAFHDPVEALDIYLHEIYLHATQNCGYLFNSNKYIRRNCVDQIVIPVTTGQLAHERQHLLGKLQTRDVKKHATGLQEKFWDNHPMFRTIEGPIESWEKV